MAWWGKLVGGTFGFMMGGPLGALMGVALGDLIAGNRTSRGHSPVSYTHLRAHET